MAAPYPPSITRVPATDSNDDVYKIQYTERYKTIAQNNYGTHLELGQSIPPEQSRILASHLLQSTEMDAVLNKEGVQYLGREVLNVWMEKQGSTILVLHNKLQEMGLEKTLAILENARLGILSLDIVIYERENNANGPYKLNNTRNVPGGKPLVDVIRPNIYRTHGFKMTQREKILNLLLARSTGPGDDQDITWNSPARNFKGVQVDIHMFYTNASERPHTDPGQKLEGMTRIERNVISWIDEATLCFGYVDSEPVTASEELVQPVQEMGQVIAQSMDGLSLKSDPSLEGQVSGQAKERRTAPEEDESSDCPGLRISDDPTTQETSMGEQSSQQCS